MRARFQIDCALASDKHWKPSRRREKLSCERATWVKAGDEASHDARPRPWPFSSRDPVAGLCRRCRPENPAHGVLDETRTRRHIEYNTPFVRIMYLYCT